MEDKEIPEGLFDHRRRPRPLPSINLPFAFMCLLTILLIYLKVHGQFDESWFWVFMPLYWPLVIVAAIVAFLLGGFIVVFLLVMMYFSFEEVISTWKQAKRTSEAIKRNKRR